MTSKPHLVLAANAASRVGGQGQNLFHMLQALRDSFELSVLSQAAVPDASSQVVKPSPLARSLGRVPVLRRRSDWLTLAADLHFDSSVAARMPRGRLFQGVVGQSAWSLAAARLRGMRTVLDVVNTHVDDLAEQAARECEIFGTKSFLGDSMKRRVHTEYRRADLIRVMSHHAKRTFEERGVDGQRIVVATPPIDLGEFPQAKFDAGKFRICFVGLLQPWKGFHYLIEAFQRLALRDAELTLWGGSGARPITRYLEEKLASCRDMRVVPAEVRRVGYEKVYGSASVLVHPSLTDGFGYVVAEAMASGIPVIVSQGAGASDLVVDGVNGYLVPPRDVDAIADRLRHLAERPALVREMGAAARETAASLTIDRFRGELVKRMKHLL